MTTPHEPLTTDRRRQLARFHAVARELDWDEAKRRAFLRRCTGKLSCADLTDEELARAVAALKPTRLQWSALSRLCHALDYTGFEDPGFRTMLRRIAKAEDPRHLTRPRAAHLILGLRRWLDHRRARVPEVPPPTAPATALDASTARTNENAPARDHRGVDLAMASGVEWKPSREARQGRPA